MRLLRVEEPEYVTLRIIPHSSVLNNTTRRLWHSLHDLMAMDASLLSRLRREGRQIVYKPRSDLWWVVTMKYEETPSIEFYVRLPRPMADVFTSKLANFEAWRRCTLQEVNDLSLSEHGVDAWQIGLQRADMFSLGVDYTRQTSPIRDLLSVSHELNKGDSATLVLRMEALSRKDWRNRADYDWNVWRDGGVPQRPGANAASVAYSLRQAVVWTFSQAKEVVQDIVKAIGDTFLHAENSQKNVVPSFVDPERAALLVNGELSYSTRCKRNLPAYRVDAFALTKASTVERRAMLAHSMTAALGGELNADNRLVVSRLCVRYGNDIQHMKAVPIKSGAILSTDEIGRITQLPTFELQQEFSDYLESNQRVEIEVPDAFRGPQGVFMGTSTHRGSETQVFLPTKDTDMLMTARAICGSPRMGKDQAVINMVVEGAIHHGIGSVIIDAIDERNGHRGMADAMRDHLPPGKVIDLDLGDFDHPVYVGPIGISDGIANERIAANRIAQELTTFLMGDDWGQVQTREFTREAAKAVKGDIMGIVNMFTRPEFRRGVVEGLKAQGRDVTLWTDYEAMSEGKQGLVAGPVLVRLGELMGDEALRPIMCQKPNPELNLRQWILDGKVVIYRVPSRALGETAVKSLVHWIVLNVFLLKLSLQGQGAPCWIVLNEPHQFISPGLIKVLQRLLVEGPKCKLAPVLIFHSLRQLPADFVDILLASSLNWSLFANTNAFTYQKLNPYLQPTFTPETAMAATQRFHYIASWLDPKTGEYATPFIVKAPSLVGSRYKTMDNGWLTKRHSRMYGRPIADIDAEIHVRRVI